MRKQIIVGIGGVKESGKTTTAELLREWYFPDAKVVALADKLKNVCAETFSVPRNHFDDQDKKEVPFGTPILLEQGQIDQILEAYKLDKIPEETRDVLNKLLGKDLNTPRQIAQIVGTNILRNFGEDIHCDNLEVAREGITVVGDIRFNNEFDYFNSRYEFIPVFIHRPEKEALIKPTDHRAETEIFTFCHKMYKLNNIRDIEFLKQEIDKMVKFFMGDL